MIDLNNLEEIKKLDPKDVYGSTGMFADQCQQMVETYFDIDFFTPNPGYRDIENIVICGMGGSAYGAHVALSLYHKTMKFPISLVSDYHLPGFVNEKTLVILTSYSGTTEEVLSCAQEAVAKNAKITGFCGGGPLGDLLKTKYPGFIFEPKFNPSGQPRLGTGYIVMGTIVLLKSIGTIEITKNQALAAISQVREVMEQTKKEAQELAQKLMGTIPVIFAAEHLEGNAHIIRNQLNETSKSFSAFSPLPELNHHLMEGLKNPSDKKLTVVFLTSEKYSDKLKKRVELTKDVVSQNNIRWLEYKAKTQEAEVLNVLAFGGYLTLYLAFLYGQDPSLIPWVDYFKDKLKA